MEEQRIPGLQIAIVQDGRVTLSESYGLANVENRVPATNTTLFPLNSATKSFTGVAMMQLAEAGLVDLNAPVSRYLDDLPKAWRTVRVRRLLAHTSGLPDILDQQGLLGGGLRTGCVEGGKIATHGGTRWQEVRLQPDQLRFVGEDHRQTNEDAVRAVSGGTSVRRGRHAFIYFRRQL